MSNGFHIVYEVVVTVKPAPIDKVVTGECVYVCVCACVCVCVCVLCVCVCCVCVCVACVCVCVCVACVCVCVCVNEEKGDLPIKLTHHFAQKNNSLCQ